MSEIDVNALQAGTTLRHRNGSTVTLKEPKADGSGWWNTDSSGFCWAALESGDYTIVPAYPMLSDIPTEALLEELERRQVTVSRLRVLALPPPTS